MSASACSHVTSILRVTVTFLLLRPPHEGPHANRLRKDAPQPARRPGVPHYFCRRGLQICELCDCRRYDWSFLCRFGVCRLCFHRRHAQQLAERTVFLPDVALVRGFRKEIPRQQHGHLFRQGRLGRGRLSFLFPGLPAKAGHLVPASLPRARSSFCLVRRDAGL